jgi:hypothetical protein
MITQEEYLKAKAIVDEYEKQEYEDGHRQADDDLLWDDDDFDEDSIREIEEERRYELALSCSCGAWAISKNGNPIHIADCCCGAE